MTAKSLRNRWLKLGVVFLSAAALSAIVLIPETPVVLASASGPSPSFTDAPMEANCTACHIGSPLNSGGGSIQITGLPSHYLPGQEIALTVNIAQEDAVSYGFQLTAIDNEGKTVGSFSLPVESPARSQIINNVIDGEVRYYVEHTVDGLIGQNFGSNSWTFTWTAPAELSGPVTFFAAGNAANGDGSPAGDFIYTTTAAVQEGQASITIGGRVFTSGGSPLRNAVVRLVHEGGSFTMLTSTLGFYSFEGLPAGQAYTIHVASKRYRFQSQTLTPSADLTNVDFTGLE